MKTAVIIPFRCRGTDPLRFQNLTCVADQWAEYGHTVQVVSDGRRGADQFNRSAAYNRGAADTDADILIFAESDLLISDGQIDRAVAMAAATSGLVIPFSWFMALSEEDSRAVRSLGADPAGCQATPVKGHRSSIGAINIMSRETYELVGGYDEVCTGAWYDDDIMKIAFDTLAGPTRWVEGSAFHLYHLSGGRGSHLSAEDRAATARNRRRLRLYQQAKTPARIRELIRGAKQ
mgnify:CR=1 FL=1